MANRKKSVYNCAIPGGTLRQPPAIRKGNMSIENDETLKRAVADIQTVSADGKSVNRLTHGVSFRDAVTHADARGSVVELFDPRWNWHPDPLVFAYSFTIRPGIVKGWNLHKLHEDRYFLLQGEMELVLYDIRPQSPTYKQVCRIVLSEHNRRLVNVPKFVWHADHNIGTRDVVAVNFPTTAYDHAAPDKYRLPSDTKLIPHSCGDAKGW
jgi:dTDP-4-dehydrorhamnose 3,5-epimerase